MSWNTSPSNFQSTAPHPSYVTLPVCESAPPSLLDFFDENFPNVGREVWRERLEAGKIFDDDGQAVTWQTPYTPHKRLRYYREVEYEAIIPFKEEILFQNDHILVACKPHFLPVTPAGPYVNECLLYRLKRHTGIDDIVPVHRIDRETAGLVMFSIRKHTRGIYHELFSSGSAHKTYEAVTTLPKDPDLRECVLHTRIVRGDPWFRVKNAVHGTLNAKTQLRVLDKNETHAYLRLEPCTGKQHQLRLHVTLLGCHILYDRYYPNLQPKRPDDYARPLQLLAKSLEFIDPLTRQPMAFHSTRTLLWKRRNA